jgi:hypothetical protein
MIDMVNPLPYIRTDLSFGAIPEAQPSGFTASTAWGKHAGGLDKQMYTCVR